MIDAEVRTLLKRATALRRIATELNFEADLIERLAGGANRIADDVPMTKFWEIVEQTLKPPRGCVIRLYAALWRTYGDLFGNISKESLMVGDLRKVLERFGSPLTREGEQKWLLMPNISHKSVELLKQVEQQLL